MDGTLAGTDSWFANPASQVSAHYGVALSGDFHRYVSRFDTAWANGLLESGNNWPGPPGVNPNWLTVSIETEDNGDQAEPVTTEMYATVRTLVRTVLASFPSIAYLMGHRNISPRSRPNCPGPRWVDSGTLQLMADELTLTVPA